MTLTTKAYRIIHEIDGPQGDIEAIRRNMWLKLPENSIKLQRLRKEVKAGTVRKTRGVQEKYQWDKDKIITLIKQYKNQSEIGEAFGASAAAFRGYMVRNPDVSSVWQKYRSQRRSHVVVKGDEKRVIENGLIGLTEFFKLNRTTVSNKINGDGKIKGYKVYTYKDWLSRGGGSCI
ncbi:MAG: hypothetical protein ABF690_13195 [Liquorilactobacillus nagelii]|uniref:hypothetical protein n=1 Tax=Lactobacillaceae TaxID=33958 RepID=UPI0039E8C877